MAPIEGAALAEDPLAEDIPARLPEVMEALAGGRYDGWHFTGHGLFRNAQDPNRSGIVLEGGQELRPADLSGRVKNLGRAQPLVFLNACQAGRGGLSLTDIGGWAAQTLKAGAGGFIAAYWSIGDGSACQFAKAVYARLTGGVALARAVREARAEIRDGDPTYLAIDRIHAVSNKADADALVQALRKEFWDNASGHAHADVPTKLAEHVNGPFKVHRDFLSAALATRTQCRISAHLAAFWLTGPSVAEKRRPATLAP